MWEYTQIALRTKQCIVIHFKATALIYTSKTYWGFSYSRPYEAYFVEYALKELIFWTALFFLFLIMKMTKQTPVSQHLDLRKVKYFKYSLAYFYYIKIQVDISEQITQFFT